MRTALVTLWTALLAAALSAPSHAAHSNWFTGRDAVGDRVAEELSSAGRTIDAALYALKLPKATDALIAAAGKKVKIRVVVDAGHAKESADVARLAATPGIKVRVLAGKPPRGLMHNKIALLDGARLLTGSFNWTNSADNVNLENAVLRDDPALLKGYAAYWKWLWDQASPYDGPAGEAAPRGPPPTDPAPGLWFKGEPWPSYSFSPEGGTEAALVKAIGLCTRRIEVAMFSFYGQRLADALIAAKGRGVTVRVVVDAGQAANSKVVDNLVAAGVTLRRRSGRGGAGVLHHKFALFDGELLETGSFNWSVNAEVNSHENVLFSTNAQDLSDFEDEFERTFGEAASS